MRIRFREAGLELVFHSDVEEAFVFGDEVRLRSVVDLHGGSVCATSKGIGFGSQFEFRLPISEEERAAHAAQSAPP